MNKHFDDVRYYLGRAGEHVKLGVREAIEPAETRLRELSGMEREPEPTRIEALISELKEGKRSAEGQARKTVADARKRVESYRSGT